MQFLANKLLLFFVFMNVNSYCWAYFEWDIRSYAFDQELYESVLDSELCQQQMSYVTNNTLLLTRFLDAGIRLPRGMLDGNFVDMGNYYKCIGLSEEISDSVIGGKYCSISVPLSQESISELTSAFTQPHEQRQLKNLFDPSGDHHSHLMEKLQQFNSLKALAEGFTEGDRKRSILADSPLSEISITLSVCIPKTCTVREALNNGPLGIAANLNFTEQFCRLPNDKPWVGADNAAVAIFSTIFLLTILSTAYDVHQSVILNNDPESSSKLLKSFSIYTNCRRLTTYKPNPKTIECLDGVRVISMLWIIMGHTFSTQMSAPFYNPVDVLQWLEKFTSVFIVAAPIAVDTFFFLSGILSVYTTAGKLKSTALVKNVHIFYLHRLLRIFPILAAGVLLQASWFNHMADGPYWGPVTRKVQNCRTVWWSTLLHVQNFVNPIQMCLGHTWYMAVDTQLHILSPLVLFWVLSSNRKAWFSLFGSLALVLVSSTIYTVVGDYYFPTVNARLLGTPERDAFMTYFYINTLTRASPFFVGMIFGYLMFRMRTRKFRIKRPILACLWTTWCALTLLILYSTYPMQQLEWDNRVVGLLVNAFMRPAWALALGWMVFACAQGYGGPLNWLLSLRMWKLPSRLSYAMYIFHYPLIIAMNSTAVAPFYFTEKALLFRFFADFGLALLVAMLATSLLDSPMTNLISLTLGRVKPANAEQSRKTGEVSN